MALLDRDAPRPLALAAVCIALLIGPVGCALSHQRDGDAGRASRDGWSPLPDSVVVRLDAFVPPRDAWSPPFVIAPHGPEPIIPDQGGPRMAHPELVVITFADDPNRASLEADARWLVTSTWLTSVGAEYGVGAGTILGMVERADAAPDAITGTGIETLLAGGIADRSLPVPAGGALGEVLYVIYFPAHTTITSTAGGESCVSFAGYHNAAVTADGRPFAYAVIPSCGSFSVFLTDTEAEEEAVAHEVIEAATDAQPLTFPAFAFSQASGTLSPWVFAGPEVADLCEYRQGPAAFIRESGFVAPHVWSNASARLEDRDPCAPADVLVPFATASVTPAEVPFVSAGETVTFDVAAWSTARVPSFSIEALVAMPAAGAFAPDAMLSRNTVANGDHATLTVRVPFDAPSPSYGLLYVQVTSGENVDLLPVVVAVR